MNTFLHYCALCGRGLLLLGFSIIAFWYVLPLFNPYNPLYLLVQWLVSR